MLLHLKHVSQRIFVFSPLDGRLKFATIISPQALRKIIPETCKAIYEALKHDYLKVRKLFICTCDGGEGEAAGAATILYVSKFSFMNVFLFQRSTEMCNRLYLVLQY